MSDGKKKGELQAKLLQALENRKGKDKDSIAPLLAEPGNPYEQERKLVDEATGILQEGKSGTVTPEHAKALAAALSRLACALSFQGEWMESKAHAMVKGSIPDGFTIIPDIVLFMFAMAQRPDDAMAVAATGETNIPAAMAKLLLDKMEGRKVNEAEARTATRETIDLAITRMQEEASEADQDDNIPRPKWMQ